MKSNLSPALTVLLTSVAVAGEPTLLSFHRAGVGLKLSWPATEQRADGTLVRPYFELQRSRDLQLWQPVGERQRATAAATPGQSLNLTIGADSARLLRLLSIQPSNVAKLGSGGAEVFGYADAFAQELQRIGQISPDQFAALYPTTTNYLPGISWDPTAARYWDRFNTNPDVVNSNKTPGDPGYRYNDYRLNVEEVTG